MRVRAIFLCLGLLVTLASCSGGRDVPVVRDYTSANPTHDVRPQSVVGRCPPYDPSCVGGGGGGEIIPPCSITSQTVAISPTDTSRTEIGVGEQVTLSSSNADSWSITTNDGSTLNSASGSPVTLTAGATYGTASVTASDTSGNCKPFTKTYTIDSQTASSYVTASGVYHHQNIADIGMYSDVYLAPDTVSFQWLYYREQQATFSANGSWICENGLGHETALTSVAVGSDYPGFGSKVDAQDWDFSGSCTGNQIQTSTETVYIPTQYALASDSAIWYSITTVTQSATEDASGNLNLTKTGGASVSTSVSSATSGF